MDGLSTGVLLAGCCVAIIVVCPRLWLVVPLGGLEEDFIPFF